MKRVGSLLVLSSALLLTACNSGELEVVHNETYYGSQQEEKVMEKPQEVVEDTNQDEKEGVEDKVKPTTPTNEKEDSNTSLRDEVEKRAEEKKNTENKQQTTTSAQSNNTTEKREQNTVKMATPSNADNKDWQGTINTISGEKIEPQAKIRKLTTLKDNYLKVVTDNEVQQFKQTLLNDFETGGFTAAMDNDKNMLTYLFKSRIVTEKTSKQDDYSLYMFMHSFHEFLEDMYLVPNSITEDYVDNQIDKLYQLYTTIK